MSSDINFDYITEYIRGVLPKKEGILAQIEQEVREDYFPIVEKETGAFLEVMCAAIRPASILEIGTAVGYSAILMQKAARPDTSITTIERYDRASDLAQKNIERAGLSGRIEVLRGEAKDLLPQLSGPYDLIFLDAAKGQYPHFLPHMIRMLRPGGMLICDNILYKGMIAENALVIRRKKTIVKRLRMFVEEILHNPDLKSCIIPLGDGLTVSIKVDGEGQEK